MQSIRTYSTLVVVIGGGAFAFSRWLASKKDFTGLEDYTSTPGDALIESKAATGSL